MAGNQIYPYSHAPRHPVPGADERRRAGAVRACTDTVVQPDAVPGERLGGPARRDAGRVSLAQARCRRRVLLLPRGRVRGRPRRSQRRCWGRSRGASYPRAWCTGRARPSVPSSSWSRTQASCRPRGVNRLFFRAVLAFLALPGMVAFVIPAAVDHAGVHAPAMGRALGLRAAHPRPDRAAP